MATGQNNTNVEWDVEISPTYPFKTMGRESIYFQNKNLLDYPHIMQGGNLCMHSAEYDNTERQFVNDLKQLKEWVEKYYVKGEKDLHYEHLVVNHYLIREQYYTFASQRLKKILLKETLGWYTMQCCQQVEKNDSPVSNYVAQKFVSYTQLKKKELLCNISKPYQQLSSFEGVYCLLNNTPSEHAKFIVENYNSIKGLFSQSQKKLYL